MRPRNPQPLFIRTAEYQGETQIDIRRIEMVPRYDRPLQLMEDNLTSGSARLVQEPAAYVIERKLWQTRQEIYGRIEDRRQSRTCYLQKRAHDQEKNFTSKHVVQYGAVCDY
jgi:hypothetical protein